jgi:hypothetical protein
LVVIAVHVGGTEYRSVAREGCDATGLERELRSYVARNSQVVTESAKRIMGDEAAQISNGPWWLRGPH